MLQRRTLQPFASQRVTSGEKFYNLVRKRTNGMETTKIVYWQEGEFWLGFIQNYPDYWT